MMSIMLPWTSSIALTGFALFAAISFTLEFLERRAADQREYRKRRDRLRDHKAEIAMDLHRNGKISDDAFREAYTEARNLH